MSCAGARAALRPRSRRQAPFPRSMASSRSRCASCRRSRCRSASPRLMLRLRAIRCRKAHVSCSTLSWSTARRSSIPRAIPSGGRWRTITPNAYEYPVFSAGPHACPGYWFGLAGVKVALAAILSRYRIVLKPDTRIDYNVQPTMRPLNRLRVMLDPEPDAGAAPQVSGSLLNLLKLPQ